MTDHLAVRRRCNQLDEIYSLTSSKRGLELKLPWRKKPTSHRGREALCRRKGVQNGGIFFDQRSSYNDRHIRFDERSIWSCLVNNPVPKNEKWHQLLAGCKSRNV